MTDKVLSFIKSTGMISGGERVCVALSGGADSVALLRVLLQLREPLDIDISAVHINHMLRGGEALRDEKFVESLCQAQDVPLICRKADVAAAAKERGISIELAGRQERYKVFEEIISGGALIATAHTASDNAETVIHRLARGSSLKGMGGIKPIRGGVIRPLLCCLRSEVEEFLGSLGQDYVTDSTNSQDIYTRNYIRNRIIPKFKKLNPSFESAVFKMSELAAIDNDYLECEADKLFERAVQQNEDGAYLDTAVLNSGHKAIKSRTVKRFLEESIYDVPPEFHHIEAALKIADFGGRETLYSGFEARRIKGKLLISKSAAGERWPVITAESLPFERTAPGITVKAEIFDKSDEISAKLQIVNKNIIYCEFDCDTIVGNIVIRPRTDGDSITLSGRPRKTFKKLLNEAAIPPEVRDRLLVISDSSGVVFLERFGADVRCAVSDATKKVLAVTVTFEL